MTKACRLRMLVLSPRPRHPCLLVHEAKTGYMRLSARPEWVKRLRLLAVLMGGPGKRTAVYSTIYLA